MNYEQRLKEALNSNDTSFNVKCWIKNNFPELAESEDDRIRKWLIEMVEEVRKANPTNESHNGNCSDAIAWLEKQGDANKKYWRGYNEGKQCILDKYAKVEKQDEKKPAVVIPKFRVGDVIRPKGSMAEYTIESISGECYHGKGWGLQISCEEDYELVEQKPWSEEDEKFFKTALWHIKNSISNGKPDTITECDVLNWFKSLRPHNRWKPSDEQMKALKEACDEHCEPDGLDPLYTLYQNLKKL